MDDSDALMAAARRHHLTRVNDVLRRPSMYGRDDLAERLLLEAMAAVDGVLDRWEAEVEALRERRAFLPTGVTGAYGCVLPADAVRDATASVYAEIAHRLGWLALDRVLPEADFSQLTAEVDGWVIRDRTAAEVITTFGPPSLQTGPTSPHYSKTLAYATSGQERRLICFHLWKMAEHNEDTITSLYPEPVVLAVRHRPGDFPASFSFTPEGVRRRPATAPGPPARPAPSTPWSDRS